MNKVARMIVMSGMAAAAALAFSAGPAAASSATSAPAASKTTTQAADRFGPSGRIVNYFRDPRTCNRVGWIGERRNQWDSYRCFRVPFGFKRGWWALQVRWDNHGGFPGHGPIGFPGHGPIGFPGHHGPGFPGHGPIGFPGHPGPHFPAKK
jgi:hypothetical protein